MQSTSENDSFAEFERAMVKERTHAGLHLARANGRVGGRRFKLTKAQQLEAREMVSKEDKTASHVARVFQVHPSTIGRLMMKN